MTTELHQGPLEAATEVAAPVKRSWRDQRELRRRRRIWLEELIGWIVVPIILIGGYWLVIGALNAMGTSPSAILNGFSTITSNL